MKAVRAVNGLRVYCVILSKDILPRRKRPSAPLLSPPRPLRTARRRNRSCAHLRADNILTVRTRSVRRDAVLPGICTHRDAIFPGRTHSSASGIGGGNEYIFCLRDTYGTLLLLNCCRGRAWELRAVRTHTPDPSPQCGLHGRPFRPCAPMRQPVRAICVLYLLPRCVTLETDIARR